MARKGISLGNVSGSVCHHRAILILEVADLAAARAALAEDGVHLLTEEEMRGL